MANFARSAGMRITALRLDNWRNFRSVDAALSRRTFLVGPNASGKSNLLDSLRFLRDIVAVGGGFQEAVRRRGGVSLLRCLAARRNPHVGIEVHIGDDDHPDLWEYRIEFRQGKRASPYVAKEVVRHSGETLLDRPDEEDEQDSARLSQTHLEQVNVNRPFRDLVIFLAGIEYLHVVPQLVREPERSVGRHNDPFGGDFLEQIAGVAEKTRTTRLRRIREALQVAVPQLRDLELERDDRGVPHLRGRYEHWRPNAGWQREDQFSDGTLRLLGLLWALMSGSGPLLLEEPELSLHPEVVRYLPQVFARSLRRPFRQLIVSTHSPELLSDPGIGLQEVLLLTPNPEGTVIRSADTCEDARALLEGGLSIAEAVLPKSVPHNVEQLVLFGDL